MVKKIEVLLKATAKNFFLPLILLLATTETFSRMFPQILYLILPSQTSTILSFKYKPLIKLSLEKGPIKYDKYCGYVFKPNAKFSSKSREYEVESLIVPLHDTGIGIRDRNYDYSISEIFGVAIGDSYTFCTGVEINQCWTEIVEDKLGKVILNLGVFGYGSIQKYNMLIHYGIKFKPKIVLYQHNFTDYKDDKYYISEKPYPIPHPQNIFREGNFFPSEIFLVSLLSATLESYNLRQKTIDFFSDVQMEDIKRTLKHIKMAYEVSKNTNAEFFLIFTGEDKFAEKELCHLINCIIPHIKEQNYFLEGHLNPEGNRILAEEISKMISEKIIEKSKN